MILATQGPSRTQLQRAFGAKQTITFGPGEGSHSLTGTVDLLYDATHHDLPIFFPKGEGHRVWLVGGDTPRKMYTEATEETDSKGYDIELAYLALVQLTAEGKFKLAAVVTEPNPDSGDAFCGHALLGMFTKVSKLWFADGIS